MRLIDAQHARLQFVTDQRLTVHDGVPTGLSIRFAGGQKVSAVAPLRRHGHDFVYTARVSSNADLHAGTKYTVRFRFAGQAPKQRLVTLR